MLIQLPRRAPFCQSVAEVYFYVTPLGTLILGFITTILTI